jgi:4a-hydroxytetrahydrobiopterin dehydratase
MIEAKGGLSMHDNNNQWEVVDYYPEGERSQKALRRDFSCSDFKSALEFVNKVAEIAESLQHHPDIHFGWGYVRIWTTSHDAHDITEKDHELVNRIDQLTS